MTYELHKQIAKGQIADYADSVSRIERIKEKDLAQILIEIAYELLK